jgi:hypothetical protein
VKPGSAIRKAGRTWAPRNCSRNLHTGWYVGGRTSPRRSGAAPRDLAATSSRCARHEAGREWLAADSRPFVEPVKSSWYARRLLAVIQGDGRT